MKKTVLILLTSALLFNVSCSSDDEVKNENDEPIIGTWKLIEQFENGEDILDLECPYELLISFGPDLTGTFTSKPLFDDTDDCPIDPQQGVFEWEKISSNTYRVTNDMNDDQTLNASFEQDKMILEYTYFDDFTNEAFETREVYQKQ